MRATPAQRPPAGVRAVQRAVATALALLCLLGWSAGVAVAAPTPSPSGTDAVPPITVTLTAVSPASPGPKDTVTLTGTVKNTSSTPVSAVQVHLWRSTDAITDPGTLDEVLASSADNPLGRRMLSVEAGNIFNVTDVGSQRSQAFPAGKTSFAPGESASFTVRGALTGANSLGLGSPGVYLAGVQVRGAPQGAANQTVGRARTLLTVDGGTKAAVGTVVLLNSRPSLVSDGVFADDHLATELRGRLQVLLQLARQDGSTLLVDPALYDELVAMRDGYTIAGQGGAAATPGASVQPSTSAQPSASGQPSASASPGQGTSANAQGQQLARTFLAALTPLLVEGRAYRTLYGSPDVALAVASGRSDVLAEAARSLPATNPLAGLPLAVVPADGQLDEAGLGAVTALHPALVMVSNLASSATVQRHEATTLVHYRSEIFDGGPGPDPSQTLPQVTGRLQAEQRLRTTPVSLVSDTGQATAELAGAPWRTRLPLSRLVSGAGSPAAAQLTEADTPAADPAWLARLDATEADLDAWGELVGQRSEADSLVAGVLPQGVSTTWRGQRAAASSWLKAVSAARGAVLSSNKVRLRVVQSFVTSSSGQDIPVTITNDLPQTVRVRVVFTSENPQRISVADSAVQSIAPGDSDTIKVRVTTHANGQVGVLARLATAEGRPVGPAHSLTITATQAGRVGWIIIIASGVVFLAGTAIRIRQVQRERRLSSGAGQAADLGSARQGDGQ